MRIIVLFNLKPGVAADSYESWARATDIPHVRIQPSVKDFRVFRATGLFGSDGAPPYAYVEILDITAMDPFVIDVQREAMQAVAAEFAKFADDPQFILTEELA
jgi:hypothetical protein